MKEHYKFETIKRMEIEREGEPTEMMEEHQEEESKPLFANMWAKK